MNFIQSDEIIETGLLFKHFNSYELCYYWITIGLQLRSDSDAELDDLVKGMLEKNLTICKNNVLLQKLENEKNICPFSLNFKWIFDVLIK